VGLRQAPPLNPLFDLVMATQAQQASRYQSQFEILARRGVYGLHVERRSLCRVEGRPILMGPQSFSGGQRRRPVSSAYSPGQAESPEVFTAPVKFPTPLDLHPTEWSGF